jgi:hypothetical protein
MRNITFIASITVVAMVGIAYLFGKDAEGPTQLAEDKLLGLQDHFKSLDALAVETKV